MKALILAAGLGTRLKPWTLSHPKALALVGGKPLLRLTIEYLQAAGIYDVIVNVHHFSDQVIWALEKNKGWGSRFEISDESDLLMDTGGAIMKAAGYGYFKNSQDFLIVNADVLTDLPLQELISIHKSSGQLATLAVSERSSSRRLLFDQPTGLLAGWENMTTGERKITRQVNSMQPMAFSGIHCLQTSIIEHLAKVTEFDTRAPFSVIDGYLLLSKTCPIGYFDHTGARFMDTGTPERLAAAAAVFAS